MTVPSLPATPVSHVDVGWFSQASGEGQRIYVDGAFMGSDTTQTQPLRTAAGGAIGRGYEETFDERFRGDVAEV